MKTYYILVFLVAILMVDKMQSQAPQFNWAKRIGGFGDDYSKSISIDNNGNVYILGTFSGQVDFDPSPNFFIMNASYNNQIFISKMDPLGNFIWAITFEPTSGGSGINSLFNNQSFCIDKNGDLIIASNFTGSNDFDSGANNMILSTTSNSFDMFICKINSSGNFVWVKHIKSSTNSQTLLDDIRVITDNTNNIILTGQLSGEIDFDPDINNFNLNSSNGRLFISKYNLNGNFIGAGQYGGPDITFTQSSIKSIAVDHSNNLIIAGYFADTIDFDPSSNLSTNITPLYPNLYNTYISKINPSGNLIWVKKWPDNAGYSFEINAITIDKKNNVYSCGIFTDSVDFDPGIGVYNLTGTPTNNGFVLKLDSIGSFVWGKHFKGTGSLLTGSVTVSSIDLDTLGNVYTTGSLSGSADFDPDNSVQNLSSNANSSSFISILDSNGNYFWAGTQGGPPNCHGLCIDVDRNFNIVTTGFFNGTADFDPNASVFNLFAMGPLFDCYVSMLSPSTVGIYENYHSPSIFIYPNPCYEKLRIISNDYKVKNASYIIYDICGKRITSGEMNDNFMEINISSLNKGIYFLQITVSNVNTLKFIKN